MDEARSDAAENEAVENKNDAGRPVGITNVVFAMSYVTAQHESLALGAMMERRAADVEPEDGTEGRAPADVG